MQRAETEGLHLLHPLHPHPLQHRLQVMADTWQASDGEGAEEGEEGGGEDGGLIVWFVKAPHQLGTHFLREERREGGGHDDGMDITWHPFSLILAMFVSG